MAKHTSKILQCSHSKIFKVGLAIFQHLCMKAFIHKTLSHLTRNRQIRVLKKFLIIWIIFLDSFHCVKSVRIRSFLSSVFSCVQTEYGEILRISVRMRENTDQKKLRMWTLFTQWLRKGLLQKQRLTGLNIFKSTVVSDKKLGLNFDTVQYSSK